jgi:NAD(P)-dependent dehydrogenase (short-subunit alcohol dehydrogenase family)
MDITEEEFNKVLSTNVKGLYFFAQEAAKAMKQYGKGGCIGK